MLKVGQVVEDVMEDLRERWYQMYTSVSSYTVLSVGPALGCLHCTGHRQHAVVADSRGVKFPCSGAWFDLDGRVKGIEHHDWLEADADLEA